MGIFCHDAGMKLTPLNNRLHPMQASLRHWEEAGVPAELAKVLQDLWDARAVIWAGAPEEMLLALNDLWLALGDVGTAADLAAWAARARQFLWGTDHLWNQLDFRTLDEGSTQWARARLYLGEVVTRLIANDGWKVELAKGREEGITYDAMVKRAARRHRERRRYLPAYPEPDGGWSARRVQERALRMQRRFGLVAVRTAGGMPIEDVWAALGEAQDGLSALAHALNLEDVEVGAGRLSVSFELDMPTLLGEEDSAHYDRLTMNINLGRVGGWGGFAHEWGHALDDHIGRHWNPDADDRAQASCFMAELAWQVLPDQDAQRQAWATLWPEPKPATLLQALRQAALQTPSLFEQMRESLPHPEWEARLDTRLEPLRKWVEAVTEGRGQPSQWEDGWNRWKIGNALAWSAPDDRSARLWRQRWNLLEAVAERMLWSDQATLPVWRAWSQARDVIEKRPYWAQPTEMWARMFHALVRHRVGHDTWAAGDIAHSEVFPQGAELDQVQAWWVAHRQEVLDLWRRTPPLPIWRRLA